MRCANVLPEITPARLTRKRPFPRGYVEGCSDAIALLHRELEVICEADFPVLLLGETGVGKEHVAAILHHWSNRAPRPFIAVNCAAVPAELIEAEMFGIGKGVASGVSEREGYFQLAEGGTLFLDEIGESQPAFQAKLLRVLQDREVRRVGGSVFRADVRIVAATNINLTRRMEEGSFRADLYYRLAGFEVHIPPLRERKEDLPLLIEHFVRLYSAGARKAPMELTRDALELLYENSWPGNIRELAQELRRAVYLCPEGQAIGPALFSKRINSCGGAPRAHYEPHSTLQLKSHVENLERALLRQALARTQGNLTLAAQLLGLSRYGLKLKLKRLRSCEDRL